MATFSNMISVFLCLAFLVSSGSSAPSFTDIESELTENINLFSLDLFKEYNKDDHAGKNTVMSAMSADMVLAMLSLGAEGKTLDEINAGLYLPDSEFTKKAYKPAIDMMNDYQHVTLHLAFKAYVKDGKDYALDPLYKAYVTHLFGSEVENIDFDKNHAAADTINTWVEDKTNHTIKDIVQPDYFDSYTALVLVNTIYFKGDWEITFNPHYTAKVPFHTSASKDIQVDMMFQQNYTKYVESSHLDAKMLELNFEGSEMTMVFILPNEVDGLAALEDTLTKDYGKLKAMYDSLTKQYVTYVLPKFKIETAADLTDDLTDLGMGTMFSNHAQLGGLTVNSKPIKVDKVVQKAYIDLNEQGVTAGAATAAITKHYDSSYPKTLFNADHPFCYGLVNSDGQIVFAGHFLGKQ